MVADPDMTGISKQLNTDQDIAYMQGILKRSVSMFPYLAEELPD